MYLGRIKLWNADRGFGFIERDDGQTDAFVHISALTEGIDSLPRGARVSFDVTEDAHTGKTRAVNVKVIA
jgi:cold shock protein